MYLMYVDESGDSGLNNSPTRYFVLTGIVIHELRWNDYLSRLIEFRKRMRSSFGLLLREERDCSKLIVMTANSKNINVVFIVLINDSVFLANTARPQTREVMF